MRTRSTTSRQNRLLLRAAASCHLSASPAHCSPLAPVPLCVAPVHHPATRATTSPALRAVRRATRAPGSLLQVYEAAKESVAQGSPALLAAALDSGCGINATKVRGCALARRGGGWQTEELGTRVLPSARDAVLFGRGGVPHVKSSGSFAGCPKDWVGPMVAGFTRGGVYLRHSFVSPRLRVPCLAVPPSPFDAPPAATPRGHSAANTATAA
jgi:hypothetical protein